MKEIEVQTENQDKEIIESSNVTINENDDRIKVIVSVGEDYYGHPLKAERISEIHTKIVHAFEEGKKVITIPSFIKINTIKI